MIFVLMTEHWVARPPFYPGRRTRTTALWRRVGAWANGARSVSRVPSRLEDDPSSLMIFRNETSKSQKGSLLSVSLARTLASTKVPKDLAIVSCVHSRPGSFGQVLGIRGLGVRVLNPTVLKMFLFSSWPRFRVFFCRSVLRYFD